MNKKAIIAIISITIFIIIAFLILFFIFTREFDIVNHSLAALSEEITGIKTDYTEMEKSINEQLNILAANISSVRTDDQKTISTLKTNPAAIKKNATNLNPVPNATYDSLSSKPQISDIEPKPQNTAAVLSKSTVNPTPTPSSRKQILAGLEDLKINTSFTTGKQAFEKGEYALSKQAFADLLVLDPPLWEVHLYYIQAAYYENPGKAATDRTVQELLDSLPSEYSINGVAAKFKGLLALEKGNYKGAVESLAQYILYKKDVESLLALGEGYLALKNQKAACSVFNEVVTEFPASSQAVIAGGYIKKIKENG